MSANEPHRQSPSDIPYLSQKDLTLADVMRELHGLKQDVGDLKSAVTGNGKPMDGLSVRVTLLERWKEESNRATLFRTGASIVNLLILVAIIAWLVWNGR